jgi:hypothetical protein
LRNETEDNAKKQLWERFVPVSPSQHKPGRNRDNRDLIQYNNNITEKRQVGNAIPSHRVRKANPADGSPPTNFQRVGAQHAAPLPFRLLTCSPIPLLCLWEGLVPTSPAEPFPRREVGTTPIRLIEESRLVALFYRRGGSAK